MRDSDLTAIRVLRLHNALRSISAFPPAGIIRERAIRIIWTRIGGPLEEVGRLLDTLIDNDLATCRDGRVRITKPGRLIATQDHHQSGRLLALNLIRSGRFSEQARLLTEAGSIRPDGSLSCPRAAALNHAPQLVGVLRKWPDVMLTVELVVPAELARELLDVWAFVPSAPRDETKRVEVGDRAEMYSYQLERLRASDASSIRWVSRENDNLGYDVEDVGQEPSRLIEVKGSGGVPVRFFLSANEWRTAHAQPHRFEIHYWGEIDLNRTPQKEFDLLRALGFPIVYRNLERLVGLGILDVAVDSYNLTSPPTQPARA